MKEETLKKIHELKEEQKAGKWKGNEKNLLKELWMLHKDKKTKKGISIITSILMWAGAAVFWFISYLALDFDPQITRMVNWAFLISGIIIVVCYIVEKKGDEKENE